jgi:hypothetical protein
MKRIRTLTLTLLALISACGQTDRTTDLLPQTVKVYQVSSENFPNPERGWFQTVNVGLYPTEPITTANLKTWRAEGVTLVRKYYLLKDFINTPISAEFLNTLKADLGVIRNEGFKLVPRFAYVVDPEPGTFPTNALDPNQKYTPDASLERVQEHLAQLEPILQDSVDVIAYLEAGFVGYWGEWHDSSNKHVDNYSLTLNDNGKTIMQDILATLPSSRMVALRYPYWHNIKLYPQALTNAQAYSQSSQARSGHHDDYFCSEKDSWYYAYDPALSVAQQKSYVEQNTRFVITTGETGPWSGAGSYNAACNALELMRTLHYSSFNRNATDNSKAFFDNWKAKGWYNDITLKLGYRFELFSSSTPTSISKTQNLQMSFDIKNVGYATPYNPRRLAVILRNTSTKQVFRIVLNNGSLTPTNVMYDPRFWQPGTTTRVILDHALPAKLPAGTYDVLLNLPDPAPSLITRPEYSIRLANQNVWEAATGYNSLLQTITVNP